MKKFQEFISESIEIETQSKNLRYMSDIINMIEDSMDNELDIKEYRTYKRNLVSQYVKTPSVYQLSY